jgi:hypothetical protein
MWGENKLSQCRQGYLRRPGSFGWLSVVLVGRCESLTDCLPLRRQLILNGLYRLLERTALRDTSTLDQTRKEDESVP